MNLPNWSKGELPTAAKLNGMTDAINDGLPVVGGPGITTSALGTGGTAISFSPSAQGRLVPILGKIVDAGPNDEANYDDYRYWVHIRRNHITTDTDEQTSTLDLQDEVTTAEEYIVTAYNLEEYFPPAGEEEEQEKSHELELDHPVILVALYSDEPQVTGTLPQLRYFITGGIKGRDWFYGKIVATGPLGQPEPAGNKHWFKKVYMTDSGHIDVPVDDPAFLHTQVTNLTGSSNSLHLLRPDDYVVIYVSKDESTGEKVYSCGQAPVLEEGTLKADWVCGENTVECTDENGRDITISLFSPTYTSHKIYITSGLTNGSTISFLRYSKDTGVAIGIDQSGFNFGVQDNFEGSSTILNDKPVHTIAFDVYQNGTSSNSERKDFKFNGMLATDGECNGNEVQIKWMGIDVTTTDGGAVNEIREIMFEGGEEFGGTNTIPAQVEVEELGTNTVKVSVKIPVMPVCVVTAVDLSGITVECNDDGTFSLTIPEDAITKTSILSVYSESGGIGEPCGGGE